MDVEIALATFVGESLFHAITHVLVHKGVDLSTDYRKRPDLLRNHDVQTALRKAAIAAANRLASDYWAQNPSDRSAKSQLKQFVRNVEDLFHEIPEDGGLATAWLSSEQAAAQLDQSLASLTRGYESHIQSYVRGVFPKLLVFAFREIGLKHNDQVRAVIFDEKFSQLFGSVEDVAAEIEKVGERLVDSISVVGVEMEAISTRLRVLEHQLNVLTARQNGYGTPLGAIVTFDLNGNVLSRTAVWKNQFRIGRDGSSDLVFHDRAVSRDHADLILTSAGIRFVSLAPSAARVHGKVIDTGEFPFGTLFEIGSFQVGVFAAETDTSSFLSATTQAKGNGL